jgi:hypothetical protein
MLIILGQRLINLCCLWSSKRFYVSRLVHPMQQESFKLMKKWARYAFFQVKGVMGM